MSTTRHTATRRALRALLALGATSLLIAGCGEGDPGALGPAGINGGLSPEGKRQEYTDGVSRALTQLGSATQNAGFARAVDTGNRRQLQAAVIAWQQGGEQLKGLDPPKDAAAGHKALIAAVEGLHVWNVRVAKAAPNKAMTKKLATQAANSPASRQFEAAVCQIVDAGYEVIDPGACTPLADAAGPAG